MLASTRTGTYWRCEHASGCAHTENAIKTGNGLVAINGRPTANRRGGPNKLRTQGGSRVEAEITGSDRP